MTTDAYISHLDSYTGLMKEIRRVAEALEAVDEGISNVDMWSIDLETDTVRGIEFCDDLFDDEGSFKLHEFSARLLYYTEYGLRVYIDCRKEERKYFSPIADANKFFSNRLVELGNGHPVSILAILPKKKKNGVPLKWKKGGKE